MNTPLGPLYRDSFPDALTRPDPDAVGASFMEAFNTISAQDLAARIGQLPVLFEPGLPGTMGIQPMYWAQCWKLRAGKRSTTSLKTEFLARSAWKTPASGSMRKMPLALPNQSSAP